MDCVHLYENDTRGGLQNCVSWNFGVGLGSLRGRVFGDFGFRRSSQFLTKGLGFLGA